MLLKIGAKRRPTPKRAAQRPPNATPNVTPNGFQRPPNARPTHPPYTPLALGAPTRALERPGWNTNATNDVRPLEAHAGKVG
jgi:hypothetical protein